MRIMSVRTAAGMVIGMGLITACGDSSDDEGTPEASLEAEELEAPEAEQETTVESEGPELTIEAVTVAIPEGWAIQETPTDYNPDAWAAGAFDDEESPTEFIRVIPAMDVTSTAADMGATRLIAEAEFANSYGESFEATDRGSGEISGAEEVHVVDFRYFEEDVEILGRWWVFSDPGTGIVAAVEHAGRADADPDFDQTAGGIAFTPGER